VFSKAIASANGFPIHGFLGNNLWGNLQKMTCLNGYVKTSERPSQCIWVNGINRNQQYGVKRKEKNK